jgi:2-keto-4-pentenoate hydratase/2-oxohepta-3-ene-1,7-dioic acid hydratase in catechol pathway
MRLGDQGREIPAVEHEGVTFDARTVTNDFDPPFFADGGLERLRRTLREDNLPRLATASLRRGSPVARPGAIICVGQNYAAHAAESGDPPPTEVVLFFKHPNTLCGPNDPVRIPKGSIKTDWEVELADVMGAEANDLDSADEALSLVAGYTTSNDLSERALQIERSGGQWSKGKCCPGFQPLGPALVVDEVEDPQTLRLTSKVNGEPRQASTTADLVFPVGELIRQLSQVMVLSPGDVINTGTPQGVGLSGRYPYLEPGDIVEVEVEGIGRHNTRMTD